MRVAETYDASREPTVQGRTDVEEEDAPRRRSVSVFEGETAHDPVPSLRERMSCGCPILRVPEKTTESPRKAALGTRASSDGVAESA